MEMKQEVCFSCYLKHSVIQLAINGTDQGKKKKNKKQVKFKKITSIQNFVIFHGDSYLLELLAIMWQGCQKCNNYFQDILFH